MIIKGRYPTLFLKTKPRKNPCKVNDWRVKEHKSSIPSTTHITNKISILQLNCQLSHVRHTNIHYSTCWPNPISYLRSQYQADFFFYFQLVVLLPTLQTLMSLQTTSPQKLSYFSPDLLQQVEFLYCRCKSSLKNIWSK